jgi:hypothetical protein
MRDGVLTEADTCREFVTPRLMESGWGNAIRQANAALLSAMLERIFSQATGEYDEHSQ